jgi:hypothetical protein
MVKEKHRKFISVKEKFSGIFLAEIIVGVVLLFVFYAIVLIMIN